MKNILKKIYNVLPFKKNIFYIVRIFNIPKSIYKHLHFKGVFKIKTNQSSFLIRHYGYQLENEIFWTGLTGGWEKISMGIWMELCKDSDVIIDIGANTGIYSLVAKSIKPSSSVYGFEPVKRVYNKYVENCRLNNFNIKCFELALSDYDGEATIYDTDSEHTYSVTVNKNTNIQNTKIIETKIHTKKLSSFIKENNISSIDLIKIDVETHEAEVLKGMEEYIDIFKPSFLIEILNDEVGQEVEKYFKNLNYLFFNIDEIHSPKLVTKIGKSDYFNYLICNKNVAEKLNLI
jgi:FkbM family methyltransferase